MEVKCYLKLQIFLITRSSPTVTEFYGSEIGLGLLRGQLFTWLQCDLLVHIPCS